jgi:hypothetical protein
VTTQATFLPRAFAGMRNAWRVAPGTGAPSIVQAYVKLGSNVHIPLRQPTVLRMRMSPLTRGRSKFSGRITKGGCGGVVSVRTSETLSA